MPIYAEQSATARELIPAGNYVARCYQLIEIGTVQTSFNGHEKNVKKVRIGWELPTELRVFSEERGEQPLVISAEYNLSTHKKSTLRAILASWRGRDFTEDEAKRFDITTILGAPCLLNIIHEPGFKDPTKVYERISSISPLPKGTKAPKAILDSFILSFDQWDKDKFNSLPEFIRNRIMDSEEFKKMLRPDETTIPNADEVTEPIDDLPF